MLYRFAFVLAALAVAVQAPAQTPPPPEMVTVAIETSKGRIVLALEKGRAPATTANFLAYVDQKKFDGESFYRAMPYGEGGLIQGGITSNAAKLLPPVKHEPTSVTGVRHVAGTIAMARLEPGSARSDFFILTTDIPGFDAGSGQPGGDEGFAAFGHVTEGMEVVKAIFAAPVSATKGVGAMHGQMLEPAVRIVKAARVDP